ncbi:MAG: pilus assembly protein TadG-related protein [Pseudomonadota bacterium]
MVKPSSRQSQRGAYSILTVFVLIMSMGAFGVLAVGHMAWEKTRLQGVADLVALTAARQMANGPEFAEAQAIALANGVSQDDDLTIECIIDNAPTNDCDNSITSRVTIVRPVNGLLVFLPNREVSVLAEATVAPTVVGSVSSGLVSVDTNQSALLNGLLTALGGGAINLNVAQWGSLLGSDIRVDLLALATELGVANVNDLLSLNLSALGLLQDALLVGNADEADKMEVDGILSALSGPLNNVNVTVGDLLALDLSGRTNTTLDVNLGQLAQVTVLNAVEGVGYVLPISSGLLNLDVGVNILEAPQVFVGRKMPYKDPIATAKTAQVALSVRIRQPLNLNLALISLSALDMRLQMRVAGGLAEVNQLTCRYPRAENNVQMTVVPSVADVCIAQSSANLNTTVGALTCGAPANILNVTLLGLVNAGVTAGASTSLRADPVNLSFNGVAPFQEKVDLDLGQTLGNLLSNTQLNLGVNLPFVGPLIQATVNGLVNTLLIALRPVLSPILGAVGDILDGLLQVLGIDLNNVVVKVDSMDCQSVVLTR